MTRKVIDFPQYRKLSNHKVFYRIHSDSSFDEIMIIGSSARMHNFTAKQYPELVRIIDMIEGNGYVDSTEDEFNGILNQFGLR